MKRATLNVDTAPVNAQSALPGSGPTIGGDARASRCVVQGVGEAAAVTPIKPIRKPAQTRLFEARTLSVVHVAERLRTSRNTVIRLLESGQLRGYRMTPQGWWRVVEQSVAEYEKKLRQEYVPEDEEGGKR